MSKEILDDIIEDKSPNSNNQEADSNNQEANSANDIPDKYKGKTIEDLINMNENAARKITELSSKGSEVKETDKSDDKADGDELDLLGENKSNDKPNDNSKDTNTNNDADDYNLLKEKFLNADSEEEQDKILKEIDKKKVPAALKETFKNSLILERKNLEDFKVKAINTIHEAAGSREEFNALMQVVKAELGDDELVSFSSTFKSGNINSAKNLVEFYKIKFSDKLNMDNSENTDENNTDAIKGNSFDAPASDGATGIVKYKNKDEWHRAMNSKAFKDNNKDFVAETRARAKLSGFL